MLLTNFSIFLCSPGTFDYQEGVEDLKVADLEKRYNFKCKCPKCNKLKTKPKLEDLIAFCELAEDVIPTRLLTVDDFRKLPLDEVEKHERAAIEFLEQNDHRHPDRTLEWVQDHLLRTWYLLTSLNVHYFNN